MPKLDVHQEITNTLLERMRECSANQVVLPWQKSGMTPPKNIASNNYYNGINILVLWFGASDNLYGSSTWGTYKQWQAKGAQVRKGEKGQRIVYYKTLEVESKTRTKADGSAAIDQIPMARYSTVFNAEQVDGWDEPEQRQPATIEAIARADALIDSLESEASLALSHGGDTACYSSALDAVRMPDKHKFTGTDTSDATESYYSVLLHELTHWTGHKSRMDRTFGKRFGDNAYAAEELVAELGAAFLCAELGVSNSPREDHAHYLKHWVTLLEGDKRAIFTAAAAASKAVKFLMDYEREPVALAA